MAKREITVGEFREWLLSNQTDAAALTAVPGVRDAYFVGITCDGAEPTNGILTPASGYFNFSAALQNLTDIVVFNPIR